MQVERQIETDAMIAKNIMKRMGEAANKTADDHGSTAINLTGDHGSRNGLTHLDFDKMMGQSLQMKRMQNEIEETKTEMKTVKSGLQGVHKEVSSLTFRRTAS